MKKLMTIAILLSMGIFAADYQYEKFTKICKRCGKVSHEIQMWAYNEWTGTWQPSWRSDTNRPGCCELCYFELQPRVQFLERPMNAYSYGGSSSSKSDNENSEEKISSKAYGNWWTDGKREVRSFVKPFGIGWQLGRLKK